jgi:hypothetical protein
MSNVMTELATLREFIGLIGEDLKGLRSEWKHGSASKRSLEPKLKALLRADMTFIRMTTRPFGVQVKVPTLPGIIVHLKVTGETPEVVLK